MRRRRGSGLLLVLIFATLIGVVVATISATTTPLRREAFRLRASDQARALAESGVLLARARLATDAAYRGAQDVPFGEGTLSVSVKRRPDQRYEISASGRVGETNAWVRAVLERAAGRVVVVRWEEL